MSREFVLLSCRAFVNRRHRAVPWQAQWLYQHLNFLPELTFVGTLLVNPSRWASLAPDVTADEIDRALGELEQVGLILIDSCTQEGFLTEFLVNGREIRHANHVIGAVRAWNAIESERLRAAVYEAVPVVVKQAIDRGLDRACEGARQTLARPSEDPSKTLGRSTPTDADADADSDAEISVVLRKLQQEAPLHDYEHDDPDAIRVKERVDAAVILLAERRVAEAPLGRTISDALADQWGRHADVLHALAWDYPNWPSAHLADAIDQGTFSG
jgi:hypothetical protein